MRLTEKYYMATPCGLVEVKGKEYKDEFAITYNHIKKIYNITHIKSGTALVKEGFKKLNDCLANADEWIEKGKSYMVANPKYLKKIIKSYNQYIKKGLIKKLETDDFSDIDVDYIKQELENRGIIGGKIVDEEKFNNNSFMRQVEKDVEKLCGNII